MPSYEADPEAVFSQEQWVAIAQSIKRDEIPPKAKQEICDALFEHAIANIKPEELGRFVEEARKFREAAARVENFLKNLRWHNKIRDLTEDIYQLQRFVDYEFKRRPKPKGGRPLSDARDILVYRLALIYQCITGKKAGRSENPKTGKLTGPFVRFVTTIFQFHRISLAGIKHAITKASRNAKNLRK